MNENKTLTDEEKKDLIKYILDSIKILKDK